MTTTLKLGYWGIRGRAQISRHLLAYTGVQWEEVAYTNPTQWFGNDKHSLGFDFPNLPYLIDEDLKLTESVAIEKYIIERSEKTDLLGKNLHDSAKVSQVSGVLEDIRQNQAKLLFDKDYEAKLKETWEKIKPKFDYLQKFVGQKDSALGYLTLADFQIAQLSHYVQKLYPEEYKSYPSLQRIRDHCENLTEIKEYYSRQNSVKGPFLPPQYAAVQF